MVDGKGRERAMSSYDTVRDCASKYYWNVPKDERKKRRRELDNDKKVRGILRTRSLNKSDHLDPASVRVFRDTYDQLLEAEGLSVFM